MGVPGTGRAMVGPETRAEVERIVAGFRQEWVQVLEESASLRARVPEPPEGWREFFTRRLYTALLKYKEEVEAVVAAHLAGEGRR